ncbi:MAG: ABC transporter permease [Dokdonella sp.]
MTYLAAKQLDGAGMIQRVVGLAREFLWRELRTRFAGSLSGGFWAVFQPLIQLGVYYFAFVFIFKVNVPGENPPGYLPFLAAGMWPWFAFSEAVVRATTVIHENAALIGKVAVPRAVLVFASVAASFLVHLTGFVFIIVILCFTTNDIDLAGIAPALLLLVPLFVFALGLALLLSAVQVFIRDLAQVLSQLMTLLMFAAPILYSRTAMPEQFRAAMDLHPFTFYAESSRALLLDYGHFSYLRLLIAVVVALAMLLIGFWAFRRLDSHFEDFL